jgi:hypothetical protein
MAIHIVSSTLSLSAWRQGAAAEFAPTIVNRDNIYKHLRLLSANGG